MTVQRGVRDKASEACIGHVQVLDLCGGVPSTAHLGRRMWDARLGGVGRYLSAARRGGVNVHDFRQANVGASIRLIWAE